MKKIYATPEARNEARRKNRKNEPGYDREFIAWDGEGIGEGLGHRYVLLANSKGHVLREKKRGAGISTTDALRFLLDEKERYPNAIHIWFGGNYDVNMILNGRGRELKWEELRMLVKNNRVFWKFFKIEYETKRTFKVSEYEPMVRDKRNVKPFRNIWLWDVLGFFQCSFVEALRGMFTQSELDAMSIGMIERQKGRRGDFGEDDLESGLLESYTLHECYALVELMKRLRKNFRKDGIVLRRYDGAGAAATAIMGSRGLQPIIEQSVDMSTRYPGLEQAVRIAYGGGRSEQYKYGHTDRKVYHGDIGGGFPAAMVDMYDLSDGEWYHSTPNGLPFRPMEDEFSLYKVYWDYRYLRNEKGEATARNHYETMFPFFYRRPVGQHTIWYPPQGYSWVWSPEVAAALKWQHKLGGEVRLLEKWQFVPNPGNVRPFEFMKDLWGKRREYKACGMKSQALAMKLAMNAMPGKMAQSTGWSGDDDTPGVGTDRRGRPAYFNLMYAGWITSKVRAKVFDVMMQVPNDIIACATDGVWSLSHLELDVGTGLGQWTYEELDGFTSIQAGVYFTKKTDNTLFNPDVYHYRGFNQGSINERQVIQTWEERGYHVPVQTRWFSTMGSVIRDEAAYWNEWCTWQEKDRLLAIQPGNGKRAFHLLSDGRPDPRAARELVATSAETVMSLDRDFHSYMQVNRHGRSLERHLSRPHEFAWDRDNLRDFDVESMLEREKEQHRAEDWDVIDSDI